LADVGWTDVTATTAVLSQVLRGLGYDPQTTLLSVPVTFAVMKGGNIDVFLGNWMPAQTRDRQPYIDDGSIEIVRENLSGAKYTLAVPLYAALMVYGPPSVPAGLTSTSDTASSVGLSWSASTDSTGTLAGYTVYRNGASIGTTNASTTTFTDSTVQPSTTYSYTVDAFDTAGNHSAQSSAIQVTTPGAPPPSAHWVQGGAVSTGTQVTSVTITLTSPVSAGDLLAGWFGQYNSSGQVSVSDNVNGAWTRSSAATTFGSSSGDIALFYLQNSAAAPSGLTITITAANATYLEAAAADYSGVATTGALDQVAVAKGNSTTVDSGPTASVGAGELVVGAILTGGSAGTVTAGSSQGQAFTMRSQAGSGSADLEDILVSAAGAQDARATFSSATDWYAVAAVFHQA